VQANSVLKSNQLLHSYSLSQTMEKRTTTFWRSNEINNMTMYLHESSCIEEVYVITSPISDNDSHLFNSMSHEDYMNSIRKYDPKYQAMLKTKASKARVKELSLKHNIQLAEDKLKVLRAQLNSTNQFKGKPKSKILRRAKRVQAGLIF
jgi:hypothetical protein